LVVPHPGLAHKGVGRGGSAFEQFLGISLQKLLQRCDSKSKAIVEKASPFHSCIRKFQFRLSCSEAHPGLCASKDAVIYHDAIALAKNLERALCDKHLNKFLVFEDPDSEAQPMQLGASSAFFVLNEQV
jgi:hypothetical protein